eukprot:4772625-Pleurochrysis_carterae.AAC.1
MVVQSLIGWVQALCENDEMDVMQRNLAIGRGWSSGAELRAHGAERKLACHRIGGHWDRHRRSSARWRSDADSHVRMNSSDWLLCCKSSESRRCCRSGRCSRRACSGLVKGAKRVGCTR